LSIAPRPVQLSFGDRLDEATKTSRRALADFFPCGTDAACKNLRVERTGRCYLRNCPAVWVILL
jgi:hypothetical protein